MSINQTVKLNPWVTATNCGIIAKTETKLTIIGHNYYSKLPTFSCASPTPKYYTQVTRLVILILQDLVSGTLINNIIYNI